MAIALYSVFGASTAFADEGELWTKDRRAHTAISAGLSTVLYVAMRSRGYSRWQAFASSFTLTLIAGTAKEMADRNSDAGDLQADAVGAAAGAGVMFTVDVLAF